MAMLRIRNPAPRQSFLRFLFLLKNLHDNVNTCGDTDLSGIKADCIIIGISHFTSRVGLIVGPAQLIALFNIFIQTEVSVLSEFGRAFHPVLDTGKQENVQGINACFLEYEIRAAAHDDAGRLRQFQDDLLLRLENIVI